MDKLYDITALGELLIDFAMNGQSEQGNNLFEACPGGAPCNVLAMLNKLGRKAAFIGKVGADQFGRLLKWVFMQKGYAWTRRYRLLLHLYIHSRTATGSFPFTVSREQI